MAATNGEQYGHKKALPCVERFVIRIGFKTPRPACVSGHGGDFVTYLEKKVKKSHPSTVIRNSHRLSNI